METLGIILIGLFLFCAFVAACALIGMLIIWWPKRSQDTTATKVSITEGIVKIIENKLSDMKLDVDNRLSDMKLDIDEIKIIINESEQNKNERKNNQ